MYGNGSVLAMVLLPDGDKKNQAQYIFNKFPDQTFNVLLNRREYRYLYSPKLIYFKQIKNGIWNTAFRINNNKKRYLPHAAANTYF